MRKTRASLSSGTSFSDSGLKNGHDYHYTVIPMGAGGASCVPPDIVRATVTRPDDGDANDGDGAEGDDAEKEGSR